MLLKETRRVINMDDNKQQVDDDSQVYLEPFEKSVLHPAHVRIFLIQNHNGRPNSWGNFLRPDDNSPVEHQFNDEKSSGSRTSSRASSARSTKGSHRGVKGGVYANRDVIYEPDKNGSLAGETPASIRRKLSRASVYPSGTNLIAQDAFGPKLTAPATPEINPSLPDTPVSLDFVEGNAGDSLPSKDTGIDPELLYFRDGHRRIDMVLVYQEENEGVMTELEARRREQRRVFQQNLLKEGLQLELEPKENSFDGKTNFLKLHIPWKVKVQYAEIMSLKLPTKRFKTIPMKTWDADDAKELSKFWARWMRWTKWFRKIHTWDTSKYPEEPHFYDYIDSSDREERFIVKERDNCYTPAQRSLIVMQILLRARYDENHEKSGIRRLLADGTYLDCFPLHEGPYNKPMRSGEILDRYLLYLIWARPSQWYKKQPLWLIRRYFGEKVALYFAWLGFYTKSLYAPAVVGLLCFIYGLLSMDSVDNVPSKEICDPNLAGNITLCPICDRACTYQKLGDSCLFSKLTYLFDNPGTVFFAIFMSFWATTFLELWKRRQAVLVWEWDLQNADYNEEPRPEFETSVKTFRINPVTKEKEPYLPVWSKFIRNLATGSIVFFMGRFFVHPGDAQARDSEFYRIKTDVCDPAGCLSEVCIQLAIIMVGKQCFNNIVEILSPKLWNWWRKRTHVAATKDHGRRYTCWEKDYQLQDPGRLALFDEYLEMILQYGFVTLFVAAFPLAPLFALLNNIAEIRLDAYKMVSEARRPLAERVEDIGAWFGILRGVTYVAVVSNAFVIAYTSDFIPRSVYAFVYSPHEDLVGYIDSSLSEFNTSDYRDDMKSDVEAKHPETCQYRGYRNGPDHIDPYGLSPQYWHVFAARLAFVVVFEHFVFAITGIMSYAIPAVPHSLTTQIQREQLIAQEEKYEKEIRGKEDEDDLLSVLREAGSIGRGSWARRFSKLSDALDTHADIRHSKRSDSSTVWQVP
ncbi:anoctamin-4 isoform X4 [Solenopsis invicta]|uniref:anoctamin-4 isoform X4 n=1 Tax=Solenopsis invicta TaxID=13686 RepID=UPI00193CCCB6|nr:anoctamin-4 isoform X4 [Solenopsis invicta]